ncbi:amino acid permease/ SLC12A domain-containing protein [Xylariaceae sp. FL1019]|nr:amino acid permease/ SLC12A domain-containing protein [Xylariaceae sp. FL1019]
MAPLSDTYAIEGDTPHYPEALKKVITTRHFILMALGSSIGAGLLVSTGQALSVSGPAPLLIAYLFLGFAVWITMCNLGELATNYPVGGSFYEFSVRFISPAWGFAMGWNYLLNFIFILPFEIIVMVMLARYWNPDLNAAYLTPIFIAALMFIHLFRANWYAEAENVFGVMKMTVLSIFIMTSLFILVRSIPLDYRSPSDLGYDDWQHHPFKNGPYGFLFAFMSAGMAYGGTEMLGFTAAECQNPRRVMRLASKLVAFRIGLWYLLSILMLGLVLKIEEISSEHNLISPFVVAISKAKIPVLPDIMNAIIIVSIFSMANAAIFASSRALRAISSRGMGPKFCTKVYKGRPIGSLVVVFLFSFLSFLKAAPNGDQMFTWFLALASCSNYLTWGSICVCQIRCRLAARQQNRVSNNPETYRSPLGITGSCLAVSIFLFGLIAQIAAAAKSPLPNPPPVLSSCLGLIVALLTWGAYTLRKREWQLIIPLKKIDLGQKREGRFVLSVIGEEEEDEERDAEKGVSDKTVKDRVEQGRL